MFFYANAYAKEEDISISQIDVNMPEVTVFFNGDISEQDAISSEAYLGSEKLEYVNMGKAKDEAIHYYILMDISASIKDSYFDDVKMGIAEFVHGLREKDGFSLITFGDAVEDVTDDKSKINDVLSLIENNNQNTLLFEAIELAAKKAEKDREYQRKVIITITDGEDFALGKTTATEALKSLENIGVPMYALAVGNAERDYINSFGEFSRNSGGNIWIFEPGESITKLNEIKIEIEDGSYLVFHAGTNRISNSVEKVMISFGEESSSLGRDVLVSKWKPDTSIPEIKSVKKISDNEIEVVFSEKVINAENASSWKIYWEGAELPIQNVTKTTDEKIVNISFETTLYKGNYIIKGIDIKDNSQEENLLIKDYEVEWDGIEYEEPQEVSQETTNSISPYILLIVLSLVIFLASLIFIIIYKKIKKNKGVIYVDGDPILVSNVEKHEKIDVIQREGTPITILVDRDGINIKHIDAVIDRSLFIGRAAINNYYFDDASLSRQHFVLEYDGENMYVTDLNSANKTKVNGIPILQRRRLERNDVITAGRLNFRVKW